MTTTRIRVRGLDGRNVSPIVVRRDRDNPNRLFYRGPTLASLTEQQAIDLANALADILEGINHEATPAA